MSYYLYMIWFFQKWGFILFEIYIKEMVSLNNMVPEIYGLTNFNQTVLTQPVIGSIWNFMRPLILSQTDFLSKLEFDSTTHVDKRTTFWYLIFEMKNRKMSKMLDDTISYIYRWNRLSEPKNMNCSEN